MPSDMQSDSSGPRARAPRKTLRHLFGPEQWTQRALIFLVCFWMLAAVVLPLLQVVERAVNADVSVAVFGDDDIRAAGHRIWVKPGGVLYIDDEPADLKNGRARRRGVSVSYNDDGLSVEVREMIYGGDLLAIKPVTARAKHEAYWINGKKLGPDEWQKTVRRSIGLKNFRAYFSNRALYVSLANSIKIALGTTFITVLLAFVYAYGLTRTLMPLKSFYRVVAMLPLFAPTMLYGLSLVYLFGNKGVITTGFFGQLPWLAADISLYGPVGIVISEVIFTFPPAMMILMVALSNMDARLYDAAASLGSTPLRTFRNVTLPGVRYGLMSAVFVCFTLSFTDFGAPKVVGGNYSVLAVDIYKQVIGQQNFGMGATVSIILLLPTFVSFLADRIIQRRQVSAMSACSEPLAPKRNRAADLGLFAACGLIAAFLLSMLFMAGYASLVKMWPYDFTLGFWHYKFADVGGGGYSAFWNSVRVSIITACVGAPLTFISAYLIDKTKGMPQLRAAGYFLSILPLALPGLVIGIAYIFFFNRPTMNIPFTGIEFPNVFNPLYGTAAILVICNVVHFYTVNFLTATTALRQLDKEFENVSESMAVPFWITFWRVTLPVCLPAVLEIAMYYFVSAMATVSAVIFLYTPETRLASVAIVNMDDAGDTTAAAAMCMLIVFLNIGVRILFEIVSFGFRRRASAWRTP
jgi:iron(III) transport system permease protein